MEVILLERVEKLGQMGEVVNVKPGFARNFLLPQRKALRATKQNVAQFETQRTQLEGINLQRRQEAETVAGRLDGLSVVIVRQASESDQLYGSVTTTDIAKAVIEAGVTIDKRQVQLDRPIKTVALHPVRINLHPEVAVVVTVNVARSPEEAELQAAGKRVSGMDDDEIDEAALAASELFEEGQAPDLDAEQAAAAEETPADEPPAETTDDAGGDEDTPRD